MQFIFLVYHYFNAAPVYNLIREFIAAYVWMTGFGNMMYFLHTNDYSIQRVASMLFRLNFLVAVMCLSLARPYMLYYICPMHTFWFLFTMAIVRLGCARNQQAWFMWLKLASGAVVIAVMYDWLPPKFFNSIWSPFQFLLGYSVPFHPELPPLHEWYFRTGLDRYAALVGMLFGYHFERISSFIQWAKSSTFSCCAISALCVSVMFGWAWFCLPIPKFVYNQQWHPYTSWMCIVAYILFRNLVYPDKVSQLFKQMGKITLESYLCQHHLWLCNNAKALIVIVPGFPMVNFFAASCLFMFASYRLFNLTSELKSVAIPKSTAELKFNATVFLLGFCGSIILAAATLVFSENE